MIKCKPCQLSVESVPDQVGACIVNKENKIVGIGYNGMPIGCNDDVFPWGKDSPSPLNQKYMYGKLNNNKYTDTDM